MNVGAYEATSKSDLNGESPLKYRESLFKQFLRVVG